MLYDEFINIDEKRYLNQRLLPSILRFNTLLRDAPKYVLTENVVQMMETLACKRPSAILKGLPICFLPHPKIWVEYLYDDFVKAAARIKTGELRSIEGTEYPHRLGYLFEQDEVGFIRVSMGWIHHNIEDHGRNYGDAVHLCPMSWYINTDADYKLQFWNPRQPGELENPGSYMWEFRHSMEDVAAYDNLADRCLPTASPYAEKYLAEMKALMNREQYSKYVELLQFDMAGEWRHALAILMVLNSRTCIEYSEVDRTKLSKARVKSGKAPTDNYHEVKFKLSRVQYNAYTASGRKMDDLAKHLVMAHLKVRKTGVFLWSSHVRGYKGEVKVPTKFVIE